LKYSLEIYNDDRIMTIELSEDIFYSVTGSISTVSGSGSKIS
jgi:hypothetical protein